MRTLVSAAESIESREFVESFMEHVPAFADFSGNGRRCECADFCLGKGRVGGSERVRPASCRRGLGG